MSNDLDFCLDCHGHNAIADYSPWCGACAMKREDRKQYGKAGHS